jgi:type I restriction enzyme S subunit
LPVLSEWQPTTLGRCLKIKHGYAFEGEHFTKTGDFLLLTPGNFKAEGGLKFDGDQKFYDGEFPKEFLLRRGDLIVVMTDLKQDAPILGSPAFIPDDNRYLHNQRLGKIVDADNSLIDQYFLFYLFNTREVRAQIKGSATGTTVRHTAPDRIYAVKVRLPPVTLQRKIASILSAYDDLIENNTRRISILEEMAQLIYREWFVNFKFPGREKAKMVESDLGIIPEGWEVRPIGEVIETFGGSTPSTKNPEYWTDGDVTWFIPTDLTRSGSMFVFDSEKKINQLGIRNSSARMFPAYSVMMTSRATIGVTAINTKEACTNQGFITCIPNERLSASHIYFWIQETLPTITSIASGATYKEINRTEFRALPVVVPPAEIERRFLNLVDPIAKHIEILLAKNLNLRQTRDLLLPKLVSGEVDVSALDIETGDEANG